MEATCQEQFAVDSVVVLCGFISGRKMEVRSVERVDETRLRAVGKVRALCPFPEFDFHMLQKPQHFSFEGRNIPTWRLHPYLPPVCAHDAACGRLNGSHEASHATCLEHQPSTVASKRRKIHLRIGTGLGLHRRLGQLLGRHEVNKTLVGVKEDQAIRGRRERNEEEATGAAGLMTERAMPMPGMAAMPLTEAPGTQEIAIEVLLTLLTKPPDPNEMEIDHLLAFPTRVAGMPIPKKIKTSRRSQDSTTKVSAHTATTLGSSQRVLDLNELETSLRSETNHHLETSLPSEANLRLETGLRSETSLRMEESLRSETSLRMEESLRLEESPRLERGLRSGISLLSREALGLHQREKRTPLMLSTGALVLRVMETEALRSTEATGPREMDSAIPPALSAEVRAPRVMENEARPTEALGRLTATASNMTMSQWPYHIPAPQANGCMVSTLS
jgi:hypothetical protein